MKPKQLFDLKTRTLGFAFCQPPKKSSPKSLTQKKSLQNFKPQKKSSDRKFQTQKRASHIPVTYIPEYPPPPPGHKGTCHFVEFSSNPNWSCSWTRNSSGFSLEMFGPSNKWAAAVQLVVPNFFVLQNC